MSDAAASSSKEMDPLVALDDVDFVSGCELNTSGATRIWINFTNGLPNTEFKRNNSCGRISSNCLCQTLSATAMVSTWSSNFIGRACTLNASPTAGFQDA